MTNDARNLNLHKTKDLHRNVFLVIHLFAMAFKEVDSLCDKNLSFLFLPFLVAAAHHQIPRMGKSRGFAFVVFVMNFISVSISLQCNQDKSLIVKISSAMFAFMFDARMTTPGKSSTLCSRYDIS